MQSRVYKAQMKFFCIDNIGTIKELAFFKWNNIMGIMSAEKEKTDTLSVQYVILEKSNEQE